uniref:succinate:cytochrome c oxidoreductase subunit 4 n=1 Tax=Hypnea cervicornis TaxID=387623 RepID=UPI0021B577D8|nr:succinate:cytochrome c oxidoreductase subunit 4 [Hypnea cervicornis]UVW80600.1 succinate:cytochrome c oxidoreductase subunit 4 [Hypnea cervicornis]WCH57958.1 succinate dehydrogenase subunit 4 [Hypnea marchantiae]
MFNLEWILIRFSSLFTLFGIIFDLEIVFFVIGFLFTHISLGICSILYDYIHIKKLKYLFIFLVKILSIEIAKNIMEFFF